MKKAVSLALALILCLALLPVLPARAAAVSYAVSGGNIYFDLATGTITDADETVTFANIPASIEGYSVTKIGVGAFRYCAELKEVIIPEGVSEIAQEAFWKCSGLTKIYLPLSLKYVKGGPSNYYWSAFKDCSSLSDVYYAGSVSDWANVSVSDPTGENLPLTKATIHYNSSYVSTTPPPAEVVDLAEKPKAVPSPQKLVVNGEEQQLEMYNIDGLNYIKLRDLAFMLNGTSAQFSVGYDTATKTATVTSGETYQPNGGEMKTGVDNSATAVVSSQTIIINNVVQSDLKIYNIGGNNFFQIRNLENLLGYTVGYDDAAKTGSITTP